MACHRIPDMFAQFLNGLRFREDGLANRASCKPAVGIFLDVKYYLCHAIRS